MQASLPDAPDASLTAPGAAFTVKGLTYPLGSFAPLDGDVYPIADGIGWMRLSVPGSLKHINVWLLDDSDDAGAGIAVVDTGLDTPEARACWTRALDGRRVTRVICTHFHPDHTGLAGWLCAEHHARLWMNRAEYYLARLLIADRRDVPPVEAIDQLISAGWTEAQIAPVRARGWGNFAKMVSPLPVGHVRLSEGETLRIGKRDWVLWQGAGHSPEHMCLVDTEGAIIIAGDQILPRITSNVSVTISEPEADPLAEWLASIDKFRALPGALFVLPGHGEPFYGLHARLDRLEAGHRTGLDRLHDLLGKSPRRAVDCFGALFARAVDDSIRGLATGEALAHLRHLELTGRATSALRDGVRWYSAL